MRHPVGIVFFWVLLAVLVRGTSPNWESLALDGDFDYLPQNRLSIRGERMLDVAFPANRPRSQVVILIARPGDVFDAADELASLDLLRRLHHRLAEITLFGGLSHPESIDTRANIARESLNEAIEVDEDYFELLGKVPGRESVSVDRLRLKLAYLDRSNLLQSLGLSTEAGPDMQAALMLDPDIATSSPRIADRDLGAWTSLLDLVSWHDTVVGQRLRRADARMIVLQSRSELAATHNIEFLEAIEALIAETRQSHASLLRPGLEILPTGSAAIGGATLTAAKEAIKYTEWFTVLIVLAILAFVYRSPLLIAVPLVSIGLAVAVSTGTIAWLAYLSDHVDSSVLGLKIFTTSRIFLFVILFGAGTDYCLFLISRAREEAVGVAWESAVERALAGVSGALLISALTTVVGLGMLWIAQFGKYHYTGPMIGICLLIALAICLTFTPAVLRLMGPRVFWPNRIAGATFVPAVVPAVMPVNHVDGSLSASEPIAAATTSPSSGSRAGFGSGVSPPAWWGLVALWLTRRPIVTLLVGIGILLPLALPGWSREDEVTYDFSSQLSPTSDARRGFRLLDERFGIGEINPTTVLLVRPDRVSDKELGEASKRLVTDVYAVDGVRAVRFADDPLGDFPPSRQMGLFDKDAWKRRALKTHRISRNYFFSESPEFAGRLIRLDVVMEGDPFESETAQRVTGLGDWLRAQTRLDDSPIRGAEVLLAGTTPSIIDLRDVTTQDRQRIKWAVVISVFLVLFVFLRRIVLCGYLIFTVLLSYYATLGVTLIFFSNLQGADYLGLDWKLPLFLFVILVAIGQDYNVYLVTRIVEEQRSHRGWLSALRRAVTRTGGIITACGLVMAGTFLSMTASAWFPPIRGWLGGAPPSEEGSLRGIVQLGFALGIGVLLDTFYVRILLVPPFVALLDRYRARRRLRRS
ncbi:MAG: MMPL family transporter [Planctomycetaceae bacterium]|nr:MAG: MMPL family transporter [Planctomycetaceae bacterium]